MPTTRKQKKAGKSRKTRMLFDIENLDILLEGNNSERDRENKVCQATLAKSLIVHSMKFR